jgi:hypothetical protein
MSVRFRHVVALVSEADFAQLAPEAKKAARQFDDPRYDAWSRQELGWGLLLADLANRDRDLKCAEPDCDRPVHGTHGDDEWHCEEHCPLPAGSAS